jgi:hypothetical protein
VVDLTDLSDGLGEYSDEVPDEDLIDKMFRLATKNTTANKFFTMNLPKVCYCKLVSKFTNYQTQDLAFQFMWYLARCSFTIAIAVAYVAKKKKRRASEYSYISNTRGDV